MKKINLLAAAVICLSFFSCSKNPVEQQLEKYVVDRSDGHNVKYKLKEYRFIDTITYSEAIDSLRASLTRCDTVKENIEEFKKKRNREFVEFHSFEPNYEEKVMHGELRDASSFCTEIREITEMADSLINIWDSVDIDSYEYNYLVFWYVKRMCQFWNLSEEYEANYYFKKIIEDKDKYDELKRMKRNNPSDIYEYKLIHEFSIYNPLFKKRIDLKELVTLDKNLNFKKSDDLNDFGNLIMQAIGK